jgi:hypothetical protein
MSSISAGTTTTTGYVVTSDSTGALVLKTGASATTAVTIDTSQNVTFVGSQTLSAGTANGVLYLNGSKVATSGSALSFDGSNLTLTGNLYMTGGSIAFDDERYVYSYAGGSLGQYMSGVYYDGSGLTQRFFINNSEQMRLTSTGLGIGTSSPATKLDVNGSIRLSATGYIGFGGGTNYIEGDNPNNILRFATNNVNRLIIDASGNLGLGVTPSAWFANSRVIQMGSGACVGGRSNDATISEMGANQFINSAGARTYISTAVASLYEQNSGQHRWYVAPSGTAGNAITFTQAMTLDASGRLGIGTTSPSEKLQLEGSGSQYMRVKTTTTNADMYFGITSSSVGYVGTGGSDPLAFFTGGTERARIDSSGRFGIGTSSWNLNSVSTKVGIRLSGTTGDGISLLSSQNTAGQYVAVGAQYDNTNTNNGSQIRFGIDSAGDTYSMIAFATASGSTPTERARITSSGQLLLGATSTSTSERLRVIGPSVAGTSFAARFAQGSYANGYATFLGLGVEASGWSKGAIGFVRTDSYDVGNIVFCINSNNTNGTDVSLSDERARIDSSGNLLVGATSSYTSYASIQVTGDNKGVAIRDTTDGSYRAIYNQSGTLYFYNGSNEGYLSSGGAWVNASDARLKTNVRDVEYGLTAVMQSKPRSFERVDIDGSYVGFVAQELQELIPEVVSGRPEKQLGVDYGSLVAVAFKAIQEQQALIETLTQRITALEGR